MQPRHAEAEAAVGEWYYYQVHALLHESCFWTRRCVLPSAWQDRAAQPRRRAAERGRAARAACARPAAAACAGSAGGAAGTRRPRRRARRARAAAPGSRPPTPAPAPGSARAPARGRAGAGSALLRRLPGLHAGHMPLGQPALPGVTKARAGAAAAGHLHGGQPASCSIAPRNLNTTAQFDHHRELTQNSMHAGASACT